MFDLLTPFGILEISLITALSVVAIILLVLNIVFIVRISRNKKTGQGGPVHTNASAPAPHEEPQPESVEEEDLY